MERNFETVMIEQCAPVLAGLKPAGLFRYETRDCADLAARVHRWNDQLGEKGLKVRVLKGCAQTHRYLIYVYRESRLRQVLADEAVREFLQREGYALPEDASDCDGMLRQLSRRLCCEADFPHEIGVFLGYPLWGDRIFEKCGIRRDEGGDGGKTLEIRGKRRLSARDGGANYQQS